MVLSIIIVNYNTSSLLKGCLFSVYKSIDFAELKANSEVIVVDNASSDESVKVVRKNFPKVRLIENKTNLGFAKANNQGIENSRGKLILLLNSDTEIQDETLKIILDEIRHGEKIGVLGCNLLNNDGSIQASAGYFPTLFKVFMWMSFLDDIRFLSSLLKPYHVEDTKFYAKRQEVDWVSGACFLVKKEALNKVGLFDEKFFMYGEEMELCFRVKKVGYKIIYTPETKVFHFRGKSSREPQAAGISEEFNALLRFYDKHKSKLETSILISLLKSGAWLRIILFGIIKKYPKRRQSYAQILKNLRR